MTDKPENLILEKLALLSEDMAVMVREWGEKIATPDRKVAVAVDEHTRQLERMHSRLDRIEKHLGLVSAE